MCVPLRGLTRTDARQVLINFTMGLIGAFVAFVWYIYGVISSYQVASPDACAAPVSASL